MIRILGAITGSALALATLLVVIGIPQFKTEGTASDHAIVTLPLPTTPVDPQEIENVAADAAVEPNLPLADSADEPVEDAIASVEPGDDEPPVDLPHPADLSDPHGGAVDAALEQGQPVLDSPQSWYAFWSPFRSELAANGFVAQLQSVTGLDYRVVRIKPGVYEVAFAYESDDDIASKLTQITAATGLELPQ